MSDFTPPLTQPLTQATPPLEKLKIAYLSERDHLEQLEVELNRSKIVMIDSHGKLQRFAFIIEH
ncbi:hypothetical protein HGP28_04315 [Vibrio sp. SM6]|uniref:Uncharacterized protein n=1 Tax=Vibrio agarilyticus TaxID=2726741 RepID=A0A7X8TNN6_9VIBR|nr:hypothetical protein [Vibrio agarilyticus]NLS12117.1 hypothetical protein [Vibrio agarilyticus]